MEALGIVGVGRMGIALLERLLRAGAQVTIYDVSPAAAERAGSMGATVATSAAELGRMASIIHVLVRTDQQLVDCMTGERGILEGVQPETLVLLHGTTLPETTRMLANLARERGAYVMDACMRGQPNVVQAGEERFLLGGPVELADRARSHLLRIGKEVLYVGPVGAANLIKLVNNLLRGVQPLILYEAIEIARAGGIPYQQALDVLRQLQLSTVSVLADWETTFDPSGSSAAPRLGNNLWGKDLPLLADLAAAYGVNAPITRELAATAQRLLSAQRPG